jgi:dienelactone hydrolase
MSAGTLRMNRRELLLASGLVPGTAFLAPPAAQADAPLKPLNRFPRMVEEYFVERVRSLDRANRRAIAALRTKADAEAYVAGARKKIALCFGPFPPKTPLNPRVTGRIERDAYHIEKILFESRPGFLVTANLYVPKGRKFPLPGVVASCGHSNNGKAVEAYQSFTQGLARMGYVVLIFDPIGQGERLQYVKTDLTSRVGAGVGEHLRAGNQQVLVGEALAAWRAWDGIRALDYLLTRNEVDPRHVGVTGNSGGGTMTTWLCGLDPRWTMAAPSCFVTTFLRNLENELPLDPEQYPPKTLALGLDMSDFLAAMAPKPVILLAKEKDYFDVRGSEEAYRRLKRLYTLLGASANIGFFAGPTTHGYTRENREAMYGWFNRATGISDRREEPPIILEKDETLQVTPAGQVAALGSRAVWGFTREKSLWLAARRKPLGGAALAAAIPATLKLPGRTLVPDYRILRPLSGRRYPKKCASVYAVETEPGIHALVYMLDDEQVASRPPKPLERALLYVSHESADAELREEPLIGELIEASPGAAILACDLRGIGESRPDTCGMHSFSHPYGSDYFYAGHSLMLDRPYIGQRTHDLLRVLDWLRSFGCRDVHLAGKGWGAIAATFAAVLHANVRRVTLKGAPRSFAEIAETEDYHWPLAVFAPGLLKSFDLPDCYRALEPKQLRLESIAPSAANQLRLPLRQERPGTRSEWKRSA